MGVAAGRRLAGVLLIFLACLAAACSASARAEAPVIIITATPSPTPRPAPVQAAATATLAPPDPGTPASVPTPCIANQGEVSRQTFISEALDSQTLPFRLYLPPCYAAYPDRRYPVLYLLPGLYLNEDAWVDLGVVTTADDLIEKGEVPPFMIVMPYAPDDNRFTETVVFDLAPYIDSHYRTLADREHRALGGMSRGGGWTVRIGFKYPNMFGSLGMHSPAIMVADDPKVFGWIKRLPDDALPRIYIDIGDSDSLLSSASWLDKTLTDRNVAHEWRLNPGYHGPQYWRKHLPDYLRWYAAAW